MPIMSIFCLYVFLVHYGMCGIYIFFSLYIYCQLVIKHFDNKNHNLNWTISVVNMLINLTFLF